MKLCRYSRIATYIWYYTNMLVNRFLKILIESSENDDIKKYLYSNNICSRQAIYDVLSDRRKITLEQGSLIITGTMSFINNLSTITDIRYKDAIINNLKGKLKIPERGEVETGLYLETLSWCYQYDTLEAIIKKNINDSKTQRIINFELMNSFRSSWRPKIELC